MRKADPPQRKRDILRLARRIGELPRVQKIVLAMYYYENARPTEIAACRGLTECEIELIRAGTVRLLQADIFREWWLIPRPAMPSALEVKQKGDSEEKYSGAGKFL